MMLNLEGFKQGMCCSICGQVQSPMILLMSSRVPDLLRSEQLVLQRNSSMEPDCKTFDSVVKADKKFVTDEKANDKDFLHICVHMEDSVNNISKIERSKINNIDDLSAVFTDAWFKFCSEEDIKLEPWTGYKAVYSNSVADLYYEDPDTSSELWFLGGIDTVTFYKL
ncbi:hypothetical protein ACB092_05G162000 [Castanea dentata]